jgi:3-deoxy-manno-octulosonate cytidylyltransferase (CMP-KDO synthetase)
VKPVDSPPSVNATSVIALIPARFASSRLPGKPLIDLCGKSMIQRVYERVQQAKCVKQVVVATDDDRILRAVVNFGGEAVMTRSDHATGTDRLAEVAASRTESIVVNVQGDEPLISPDTIDRAVEPLLVDSSIEMATTCEVLTHGSDILNPNIVKVVCDQAGFALYFSRSVIPAIRQAGEIPPITGETVYAPGVWFKHTGLYVYRRHVLLRLANLAPSPLEQLEMLEQLRALYYGHRIKVVPVDQASPGVDTQEDVEKVRRTLQKQ